MYTTCTEHCSVRNSFSTSKLIKLFRGEINHVIIFEYVWVRTYTRNEFGIKQSRKKKIKI